MNEQPVYLNVKEVAILLRRKERTIRQYCHLQMIPHFKVGRLILFNREEIIDWVQNNFRIDVKRK